MKRRCLNFREVLDYQHSAFGENKGLYLPRIVTFEQLPEDIYYYFVQKKRHNGFVSFTAKNENPRRTSGIFFTRKEICLNNGIHYIKNASDFKIFETLQTPEEFYEFFQVKLSLDKQILYADEKRLMEPEDDSETDAENQMVRVVPGQFN